MSNAEDGLVVRAARGKFERGSFVTYSTSRGKIRAVVRREHRDGDRTIEARHYLNDAGEAVGAYLGFRFRVDPAQLEPAL